jgi:hypothetical protein
MRPVHQGLSQLALRHSQLTLSIFHRLQYIIYIFLKFPILSIFEVVPGIIFRRLGPQYLRKHGLGEHWLTAYSNHIQCHRLCGLLFFLSRIDF